MGAEPGGKRPKTQFLGWAGKVALKSALMSSQQQACPVIKPLAEQFRQEDFVSLAYDAF